MSKDKKHKIKLSVKSKSLLEKPQTFEEYNNDIRTSLKNAQKGKIISIGQLESEMKFW